MNRQILSFAFSIAALASLVVGVDNDKQVSESPRKLPVPVFAGEFDPTDIPFSVLVQEPETEPQPVEEPQTAEESPAPKEPVAEPSQSIEAEKPKADLAEKEAKTSKPKLYHDPVTGLDVPTSTIIMISMPTCGPCKKWLATYSQSLKDGGWNLIEWDKPVEGVRSVPFFRVLVHGRWFPHEGPLFSHHLKEMIDAPVVEKVVTVGKTYNITTESSESRTLNGRPWTLNSLRRHMYQSRHHQHPPGSLDHLTLEELDRLHTSDHEHNG